MKPHQTIVPRGKVTESPTFDTRVNPSAAPMALASSPAPPPAPFAATAGPFTLHAEALNYTAAEAACVRNGGHLASVLSMAENREIAQLCSVTECCTLSLPLPLSASLTCLC